MFDLAFFKIVSSILYWKEAPPVVFVNEHKEATSSKHTHSVLELFRARTMATTPEEKLLHIYVKATYPRYFGLTLRAGMAPNFVDKTYTQ